jgi:hypothetical protein
MEPRNEEVTLDALLEQAHRAHQEVVRHEEAGREKTRWRRELLEELIRRQVKQADIARHLGISPSRVSKLLSAGVKPERALLAAGPVTIAIGTKPEVNRVNPNPMASGPALKAYDTLGDVCRTYDLSVELDLVPPPGIVDLNRDNLIVLTSPRLLPLVGQVMGADAHLTFVNGAQGWHLLDKSTGEKYRSPDTSGTSRDFGYIGRLPRPDGQGTFLYLAGIHSMGTLGTAHYLAGHVEDLYREVKNKRWSVLIECQFDPDTLEIRSTDTVTPIYRHEGA